MRTLDERRIVSVADRVLTTGRISDHMSLTPEGFLLCESVGLARIGPMQYGSREVPQDMWDSADAQGMVTVQRLAEDVFAPAFLDSLTGKSVTMHHPQVDVDPSNWKEYDVGVVLNARRGANDRADLIVGDLLIKDATAIGHVQRNKPEISVGYQADYQQVQDGDKTFWKQVPVIANHVALVDDGRCGPRCAITDSKGATQMPKTTQRRLTRIAQDKAWYADWKKRLINAMHANDAGAVEAISSEAEPMEDEVPPDSGQGESGLDADGDTHIHVGGSTRDEEAHSRIDALEGRVNAHDEAISSFSAGANEAASGAVPSKGDVTNGPDLRPDQTTEAGGGDDDNDKILGSLGLEAPPGTTDAALKIVRDSAMFSAAHQFAVAGAEILSPGITLPRYTRDAKPRQTVQDLCNLRYNALSRTDDKALVDTVLAGRALTKDMRCGEVRTVFNAAVAMKKMQLAVAQRGTTGQVTAGKANDTVKRAPTVAEINKANRERYGQTAH